jgi:SNF2 family DNA or RNA helicase
MKFLRIEPWVENSIWKNCIESPVEMCDPRGIATLQTIMNRISMRRLKTTILSLPQKLETIINLELKTPWNEVYERNHQAFSDQFGKNRTSGQGWNSSSFFGELVDLRQLCNHPALMEKGVGTGKYSWAESSKIVHLMQDLKSFLCSGVQLRAVIFSEFKRFLEM